MSRSERFGRVLLALGLGVLTSGMFAASPASAAFPAFDISPGSLTLQAGESATGTLSNLPVPGDGQPGCLGVASGTVPSYLSVLFSTPLCSQQTGWSSSMTIKTIPATPAGTYTIRLEVCPTACFIPPDIRPANGFAFQNLTVVVTPAPVPVETVPFTPPPSAAPTPAPASQTPRPVPTPSRSAPRTTPPAPASPPGTQPATPAPAPTTTPTPSSPPAAATGGVAPRLALDHPSVNAGEALGVSGTGCTPAAPATVALSGFVTATTTTGPDGTLHVSLHVPPSLQAGRYPVVAQCGPTLNALVDVRRPRSIGTVVALVLGAVVILLASAALGWLARSRRVAR